MQNDEKSLLQKNPFVTICLLVLQLALVYFEKNARGAIFHKKWMIFDMVVHEKLLLFSFSFGHTFF